MRLINPILLLLVGLAINAFGQDICTAKIDFAVNEVSKSQFEISLKSSENLSNARVQLYDLYTGKVVKEKNVQSGLTQREVVFTSVKPSRYTIIIKHDGCTKQKTLGGIEGIKIGEI